MAKLVQFEAVWANFEGIWVNFEAIWGVLEVIYGNCKAILLKGLFEDILVLLQGDPTSSRLQSQMKPQLPNELKDLK